VISNLSLAGSILSRNHGLATFVHERLEWSLVDQSPKLSETEWLCEDVAGYALDQGFPNCGACAPKALVYEAGVQGVKAHPQNFSFGKNLGKILEIWGKSIEFWVKSVKTFAKSLYVL